MLTNEAEFVLLQLYRCYEDDLQDGKNKSEARYFEDEHSVRDNYFIGIDSEDFSFSSKGTFKLRLFKYTEINNGWLPRIHT